MAKFESLISTVYAVFASPSWQADNIPSFPPNFTNDSTLLEYIRVDVIPSGTSVNMKSLSGILIIDIFVEAGKGPKRGPAIADKLEKYLATKSLTSSAGTVQFATGSLAPVGYDSPNGNLFRYSYSINFNLFGVS